MTDIEPGCEGVASQLKRWTNALMAREFDVLEEVLAPDFQFTADPKYGGGRMDKARFIEMDRKIFNCSIKFLGITARKCGRVITSLAFAEVSEEFQGDLGRFDARGKARLRLGLAHGRKRAMAMLQPSHIRLCRLALQLGAKLLHFRYCGTSTGHTQLREHLL